MSNDEAYPAGVELDRLVAERVMGWSIYHYDKGGGPLDEYWSLLDADGNAITHSWRPGCYTTEFGSEAEAWAWFKPSENIAQAWDVVERMRASHGQWIRLEMVGGGWRCMFLDYKDTGREVERVADTAPHAICLAALAALSNPRSGQGGGA